MQCDIAWDDNRYESREQLVRALESDLHDYNFERLQRRLNIMTPQEYHDHYVAA
jgi:putative transposase